MRRFLVAFLFSLVFCSPYLIDTWSHGEFAFGTVLQDVDEPFYIEAARRLYHLFHIGGLTQVRTSELAAPSSWIDLCFGWLIEARQIPPLFVLVVSDVICVALFFLVANALAGFFSPRRGVCFVAASVATVVPLIWHPRFLTHVSYSGISWVATSSLPEWFSIPILRGLHAQISMVAFFLALLLLFRGIVNDSRAQLIGSGVVSGSLLYLYVFGWIATPPVIAAIVVFTIFLGSARKGIWFYLVPYTIAFTLVSVPGLLILSGRPAEFSLAFLPEVPRVWFVPIEQILVIFLLGLIARRRSNSHTYLVLAALLGGLTSEVVLFNLQPLLRYQLFPYHFSVFYVAPFVSLAFMAFVLDSLCNKLTAWLSEQRLSLYLQIFAWILPFANLVVILPKVSEGSDASLRQLLETIKVVSKPRDIIIFRPIPSPNSLVVSSLTGRQHYWHEYDTWLTSSDRGDRQKVTSQLFEQFPRVLHFCQPLNQLDPKCFYDVGIHVSCAASRYAQRFCPKDNPHFSFTEMLQSHPIDYLVWETAAGEAPPDRFKADFEPVWRSSDGKYYLYRWRDGNR